MQLLTGMVILKEFSGKYSPEPILTNTKTPKKGGGKGWEPESAKIHSNTRSAKIS